MNNRFQVGLVDRKVYDFASLDRRNISSVQNRKKSPRTPVVTSCIDMDINLDTIISGYNFSDALHSYGMIFITLQ